MHGNKQTRKITALIIMNRNPASYQKLRNTGELHMVPKLMTFPKPGPVTTHLQCKIVASILFHFIIIIIISELSISKHEIT